MAKYWAYEVSLGDHKIILRFKEKQTPMNVRNHACHVGYFDWGRYTELKVHRV